MLLTFDIVHSVFRIQSPYVAVAETRILSDSFPDSVADVTVVRRYVRSWSRRWLCVDSWVKWW